MRQNHVFLLVIVLGAVLTIEQSAFAEVLYLKNGHKMEGKLQSVDDGVWMEGMFFNHDEIDRIEKSIAPVVEVEKTSWMDKVKSKFKKDEPETPAPTNQAQTQTQKSPPKEAAQKENKSADIISQMILGGNDSYVQQGLDAYEGRMQESANVMQRAMQLQSEVNQRQMQMQLEMMRAEYGEDFSAEDLEAMGISPEDLNGEYEEHPHLKNRDSHRSDSYKKSGSKSSSYNQGNRGSKSRTSSGRKRFNSNNIGKVPDSIGRPPPIGPASY